MKYSPYHVTLSVRVAVRFALELSKPRDGDVWGDWARLWLAGDPAAAACDAGNRAAHAAINSPGTWGRVTAAAAAAWMTQPGESAHALRYVAETFEEVCRDFGRYAPRTLARILAEELEREREQQCRTITGAYFKCLGD